VIRERLDEKPDQTRSILLRVRGNGCALLLGLERGIHAFHGLAKVDPCHVLVDTVAPRIDFTDAEWANQYLASNRPTAVPPGTPIRSHPARADRVKLRDDHEVDVPFAKYAARLEEIAAEQIIVTLGDGEDRELADLWTYATAEATAAAVDRDEGDA
jgi:hypothetical protein